MDITEDNLYGKFNISPLINELINSKPFKRLKGLKERLVDPALYIDVNYDKRVSG